MSWEEFPTYAAFDIFSAHAAQSVTGAFIYAARSKSHGIGFRTLWYDAERVFRIDNSALLLSSNY